MAMFNSCNANATQVVGLANNMSFLIGSMYRLVLSAEELEEIRTTSAILLLMAQAFAVDGGRSMCTAQVGCRHLWLGLSALKEPDKKHILDLPISRSLSLTGTCRPWWTAWSQTSAQLTPHLHPQREWRPPS